MKTRLILLLSGFLFVLQTNAHVNLVSPAGGEVFNTGDTVNIQWEIVISHNTENWDLFFSGDGGITWNPIELDITEDSLNYQWVVPGTPTSVGQIRIVMDNVGNDYEDFSENFTIESVTSISESKNGFGLKVFPNPMTENTVITFANPDSERHILIFYNSEGKKIREMTDVKSDRVLFKRNNLESGMYFYHLFSKNEFRASGKIIIE
ncbi:MAG: hypothetical protein DRI54_06010 [Bacteroidetes bacterium]|nr:MAG: hypothetical protein DRI54_06010 [Bacteroidota bacterium]